MTEKKFVVQITESFVPFRKKGYSTAAVEEWYPPWIAAGDWLAAGEKFRPQVDRIRSVHTSTFRGGCRHFPPGPG